jgi:hypothetical protein
MLNFHHDDRPAALHRREDLATYLDTKVDRPALASSAEYKKFSSEQRARYNRARLVYLSGGILLNTPHLIDAKRQLTACFTENIGRNSGHSGLMLSGRSTVGKTTTLKALMQYVHRQYSAQFPNFRDYGRVPIVYIEVPAGSTGKLLMRTFAEFFGLTVRASESMGVIRSRVVNAINAAGTQLIVVDELHNLAGRSAGHGESVDVLKNLHNDLACTFVYAGIDLSSGTLLAGPRGQQLSGRFTMLEMRSFEASSLNDRRTWRGIIKSFETALPLHDHTPGTLVALTDYLHERTSGSIGSLARLLTRSASELINNHTAHEELTRELLETQRVDHAAESARTTYRRRKADPMTPENVLKGLKKS